MKNVMRVCATMLIGTAMVLFMGCSDVFEPVNHTQNNHNNQPKTLEPIRDNETEFNAMEQDQPGDEFSNYEAVAIAIDSCDGCVVIDVDVSRSPRAAKGKIHTLTPGGEPGSIVVSVDGNIVNEAIEYIENNSEDQAAFEVEEGKRGSFTVRVTQRHTMPPADLVSIVLNTGFTPDPQTTVPGGNYLDKANETAIRIPARKVVNFKSGKDLSEAVKGIVAIDPDQEKGIIRFFVDIQNKELLINSRIRELTGDEVSVDGDIGLPVITLEQLNEGLGEEISIVKKK